MSGNSLVQEQSRGVTGYGLATIAVLLCVVGVGAAYLLDAVSRSAKTTPGADTLVTRALGGVELSIPRGWLYGDSQPDEGLVRQVDLQLWVPLSTDAAALPVRVTLLQRSRVRPSSALLDGVYLHEFETEQVDGPPGLIGKPLVAEAGLSGETVWYDPLSASPFVAKCTELPGGNAQCLRMVHLGPGVGAVYSFPATALADWRRFDPELEARMRSIGAL